MTDTSQGQGWWQASDDRWYSPESHPNYRPQPPAPQAVPSFESGVPSNAGLSPLPAAVLAQHKQGWWGEHGFPFSLKPLPIVTGIVVALMAIGGISYAESGSGTPSSSSSPSTTSQAVTAPPATAPPTTTTTTLNFNVGPSTPTTAPAVTTPPTTLPPIPDRRIAQQAAIAKDQATVTSDQALVAQDLSAIQTLTTQRQNDEAQILIGRTGGSNVSTGALAATVQALYAAQAKYQQDEPNLAAAQIALQVAVDVAATPQ